MQVEMVRGHVLYDREPSASAGPKGFRRTDLDRAGQILTPSNTVLRPLVVLLCHQFPLSLPIPPPCTKTAKHSIPAQATPPGNERRSEPPRRRAARLSLRRGPRPVVAWPFQGLPPPPRHRAARQARSGAGPGGRKRLDDDERAPRPVPRRGSGQIEVFAMKAGARWSEIFRESGAGEGKERERVAGAGWRPWPRRANTDGARTKGGTVPDTIAIARVGLGEHTAFGKRPLDRARLMSSPATAVACDGGLGVALRWCRVGRRALWQRDAASTVPFAVAVPPMPGRFGAGNRAVRPVQQESIAHRPSRPTGADATAAAQQPNKRPASSTFKFPPVSYYSNVSKENDRRYAVVFVAVKLCRRLIDC
jgi:hypothetical protein